MNLLLPLALMGGASRGPRTELSEQGYRDALREMFIAGLRAFAARGPLLVHFEDAHWSDPTTWAAMRALIEVAPSMPVLVVISARTDAWMIGATPESAGRLPLGPLRPQDARQIVVRRADERRLSSNDVGEILRRADGVPLFVEACTDAFLTRAEDARLDLPVSLRDLLAERLDAMGDAREAAIAGAAIGAGFDAPLLAAVMGCETEEAAEAIWYLEAMDVLKSGSFADDRLYDFTHIMQRSAAYHRLISDGQTALHQRIAACIDERHPSTLHWEPEFNAYHYERAGRPDQALAQLRLAARAAQARFAYAEMQAHSDRAIALIDREPGAADPRMEIDISISCGGALSAMRGPGDPGAVKAYERAFQLAISSGSVEAVHHAGHALSVAHHIRAEYDDAVFYARCIETQTPETPPTSVTVRILLAGPLIWQGRFTEALEQLDAADAAARDAKDDQRVKRRLAQMVGLRALAYAFLGRREEAIALAEKGVDIAARTEKLLIIADAMTLRCNVFQILLDPGISSAAQALRQLAQDQRLPYYQSTAASFIAAGLFNQGEVERGYSQLLKGWKAFQATTSRVNQLLVCRELARGCWFRGDVEGGLAAVMDGLARAERDGERNYLAEIHRLHGALLAMKGDNAGAAAAYSESIRVAQAQGARLFERWSAEEAAQLAA